MTVDKPVKARFSINLIVNARNELLLLKRRQTAELGPGQWGFPAGHIQDVESAEECSARELAEEIGEQTRLQLLRTLGPVRDTFYGGIYDVYLFHYRWLEGEVRLNPEHTDYAWVAPDDYAGYDVMDGMDEDIALLNLWPVGYLDPEKLPPALRKNNN